MSRDAQDEQRKVGGRDDASPNSDSTNLIKRLKDNQPLSDTDEVRDDEMGEHRQYDTRAVDPPADAESV